MFERRFAVPRGAERGSGHGWLRLADAIGDDPVLQACALAYLSDDLPTDAVVALHPDRSGPDEGEGFEDGWMSASLDHAIWFHRPSRADRWHLHDFAAHGLPLQPRPRHRPRPRRGRHPRGHSRPRGPAAKDLGGPGVSAARSTTGGASPASADSQAQPSQADHGAAARASAGSGKP